MDNITDNAAAAEKKPKRGRPNADELISEGQRVSDNIFLCSDGKYRWVYELNLFREPGIIFLVWKIFFFSILGVFAFMILLDVFDGNFSVDGLLATLRMLGFFVLGMTALVALGYLIYAAIMGGKYCVMFEMDESCITHRQLPKQVKKAEAIALITALVGAASGNITTVGAGLSSVRTETTTVFGSVRHVRAYPRRSLIKVNQLLSKNRVYASGEDFDFVLGYILERVPEKAKPKTYRQQ